MRNIKRISCVVSLLSVTILMFSCANSTPTACDETGIIQEPTHNEANQRNGNDLPIAPFTNKEVSFYSLDETVEYIIPERIMFAVEQLPTFEVKPRELSAEDAATIATALLGDREFYEYEDSNVLTKSEMEENIARWEKYLDDGTVSDLVRGDKMLIQDYELVLERFKEKYARSIETADQPSSPVPCEWTFHPDSFYFKDSEEDGTYAIRSTALSDSINYRFDVVNNKTDYSVHMAYAFIENKASPNNIDSLIQEYELCRSPEPSAQQLELIKRKAQSTLESMELGDWKVDVCEVSKLMRGAGDAYTVTIKAVPVFDGIPALRQQQLSSIAGYGDENQHLFYTDAVFTYSPDGTILSFAIQSPVEISGVFIEHQDILSEEMLLSNAKEILEQRGAEIYRDSCEPGYDGDISVKVYVEKFSYGLSRIELESGVAYRYVPSLCLDGYFEIYNDSGAKIVDRSTQGISRMLVINAIDGTEICVGSEGG